MTTCSVFGDNVLRRVELTPTKRTAGRWDGLLRVFTRGRRDGSLPVPDLSAEDEAELTDSMRVAHLQYDWRWRGSTLQEVWAAGQLGRRRKVCRRPRARTRRPIRPAPDYAHIVLSLRCLKARSDHAGRRQNDDRAAQPHHRRRRHRRWPRRRPPWPPAHSMLTSPSLCP